MAPPEIRVARLLIAYDGTDFRGWARQRADRVRTVQGVLERALGGVLGEEPRLSVAGRTDAGVHARSQVASFAVGGDVDLDRLRRAVNAMTAPEVVVREASFASPGFDARRSATARIYAYRIDTAEVADPFTARYAWHRPGRLSGPRMRRAARPLLGEHDFAAFGRPHSRGGPTVRRLDSIAVRVDGERLEVWLRANAFLHQMVRSLVGTLVAAGSGKLDPGSMRDVLEARDRSAAGPPAPPHGLTLERVVYGRRPAFPR
jgi:tRNA pseudouridine38-40 synthase